MSRFLRFGQKAPILFSRRLNSHTKFLENFQKVWSKTVLSYKVVLYKSNANFINSAFKLSFIQCSSPDEYRLIVIAQTHFR